MSPSMIPIVIIGREPTLAAAIGTLLAPHGYELIETLSTLPSALSSLPALLTGPVPSRPLVVVIGRAFCDADQHAIVASAPQEGRDAPGVAFLLANNKLLSPALEARLGANREDRGPPPAGVIAERIRECLLEVGVCRGGEREGGLAADAVFGF